LLISVVVWLFRGRTDYFVGGNMFLYYSAEQVRNQSYKGPDFFFVRDVDGTKKRDYWAVWDEDGRAWRIDTDQSGEPRAVKAFPHRLPMSRARLPTATGLSSTARYLTPVLETEPVPDMGDAADDAVVIHSNDGTAWIIGTNKQRGLTAYTFDGAAVAVVDRGRLNNVDAQPLTGDDFLLAASNRTHHTLDLFTANVDAGRLEFQRAIPLELDDPYGLCMGRWDDAVRVFVGGTDGELQQWRLDPEPRGADDLLEARYRFDSQTEACVYDPASGALYVGGRRPGASGSVPTTSEVERELFAGVDDGLLVPDVEGLDICHGPNGRWLIASSQGDDSYISYDLDARRAPFKFRVVEDVRRGIDGASETDGLACTTQPVAGFPEGVLVVQDGRNRAPEEPQNFKVVDLRALAALSDGL
ncbi:MAG: phytase, partial [Rhodobacteraceae bacterium]|nr:phytase [Paracoccaceae bacterium]